MGQQVDAIRRLRRRLPEQTLALVAIRQLCWGRVLIRSLAFVVVARDFTLRWALGESAELMGENILTTACVMMGELPLPQGLYCLTTTIIPANHLMHIMVQPAPKME
jgi:hypothetical protein